MPSVGLCDNGGGKRHLANSVHDVCVVCVCIIAIVVVREHAEFETNGSSVETVVRDDSSILLATKQGAGYLVHNKPNNKERVAGAHLRHC